MTCTNRNQLTYICVSLFSSSILYMIATISNLMDFTVLRPSRPSPYLRAFTMRIMYCVFCYIIIYKLVNHLKVGKLDLLPENISQ